jgi:hypothetical protein
MPTLELSFTEGPTRRVCVDGFEPAAGCAIRVAPLSKLTQNIWEFVLEAVCICTNAKILLPVEVGVMVAAMPVMSTKEVDDVEKVLFLITLTTCKIFPPAMGTNEAPS